METQARTKLPARKPLGVRVTPDQHRLLTEAAHREHRSVSSFVLQAALRAAGAAPQPRRHTSEEINQALAGIREKIARNNPENRDILAEFFAERRAEAERE